MANYNKNICIAIKISLLIIVLLPAKAQQQPCIKFNNGRVVCAPHTSIVTTCQPDAPNATQPFYRFYIKGTPENQKPSFTPVDSSDLFFANINQPGVWIVEQLIGSNQTSDSLLVKPRTSPVATVSPCSNNRAKIVLNDTTAYAYYLVNFGESSKFDTLFGQNGVKEYSYNSPGLYPVLINGIYKPGNCGGDTLLVVKVSDEITPPDITHIETLIQDSANGRLQLKLITDPGFEYKIFSRLDNQAEKLNTIVKNNSGNFNLTLDSINTLANHQFRVNVTSGCNDVINNGPVNNMIMKTATAFNGYNQIVWEPYRGPLNSTQFVRYEVFKNGTKVTTLNNLNQNTFTDNNIICNVNYIYQVKAILVTNPTEPYADTVISATDFFSLRGNSPSKPLVINTLNSSITPNNQIELTWQNPKNFQPQSYIIWRSHDGQNFDTLNIITANPTVNNYTDNAPEATHKVYCYFITYRDSCRTLSENGNTSCPPVLQCQNEGSIRRNLVWTGATGLPGGVNNYTVNWLQGRDPSKIYRTETAGQTKQYEDVGRDTMQQTVYYQIAAQSNDTAINSSNSNICAVTQEDFLVLPTGFSPNNDQLNDVYKPVTMFFNDFKMQIFSRWGQLVYAGTKDDPGWDGTINGNPAPEDVYVCVIKATTQTGEKVNKQANITLIR